MMVTMQAMVLDSPCTPLAMRERFVSRARARRNLAAVLSP